MTIPNKIFTNNTFVIIGATICCLLWGSAYPAIKGGYELLNIAPDDIASKLLFAGYRFVAAGIVILLYAKVVHKTSLAITPQQFYRVSSLGLFQTTLQYVFFYIGLAYTTGTTGSILNTTTTFFSVFIAHFLYKNDKLSSNKLFGCIIGFIGVITVSLAPGQLNFDFTLNGEGFLVIAAFLLSAATIYGKEISQKLDVFIVSGYQLGIGGVILTVVGYILGGKFAIETWSLLWLMIYMVLLSSVAFGLWTLLLKYNPVSKVAPFNFLIPISGSILSAIFLNENIFSWKNLIALSLVCIGILIVNKPPKRSKDKACCSVPCNDVKPT